MQLLTAGEGAGQSPILDVYHDLPITAFSGWDRVWQIEGILQTHDLGTFREPAILCDTMQRDDRIGAVLDTRTAALVASPIEFKAADASAKAAKIATEMGGNGDAPGLYSEIFPMAVQRELSLWGTLMGFGIAQILWDTTGGANPPTSTWHAPSAANIRSRRGITPDAYGPPGAYKAKAGARWTPHLQVWHPQYVYWDWARMRYVALCYEGAVELPNTDEQIHSDGKWFVWAPYGYKYGWLRGLVRRLAHKYIMRGWNYRDWPRYNERHGMPILGAITPADAKDEIKKEFKRQLSRIGSDTVVGLPQGQDGNKYDIKVIEAVAKTHETFQLFKSELDDDIAITTLGQNLSTDAKGGSYALGVVQDAVRIDKRITDAGIDVAWRNQVAWWDAGYNYGTPDLAAIPDRQVVPPDDEKEEALTLLAMGQSLQAFKDAAPDLIDERALLDRMGVPIRSEEEMAAARETRLQASIDTQQRMMDAGVGPAAAAPAGDDQGDDKKVPPFGKRAAASVVQASATPAAMIAKRYEFQGIPIAVENPAGTERHWTDATGKVGITRMQHDYGFVEGVMGADKDELDVYVGPDENAREVYVIHQQVKGDPAHFDEDKAFVGFPSADAAKAAFVAHRDDGDECYGGMNAITLDQFKALLKRRRGAAGGKIRASNTTALVIGLIERMAKGRTVTAKRSLAGAKRAARYPDVLEQNGRAAAAALLARDVRGIVSDIRACTSYDDLRRRIVARYKDHMRPDQLAELIKKVNLMAHLSGRYTAIEQTGGK